MMSEVRSITFIDIESGRSWNTAMDFLMYLSEKVIGMPAPRVKKVDMVDRDGELDLTEEPLGRVSYKNRTLSFSFTGTMDECDFVSTLKDLGEYVHGKRLKIVDPDTPDWYYVGRCTVHEPTYKGRAVMFVTVTVDADPYRVRNTEGRTGMTGMVPGHSLGVTIHSMPVVPKFQVSASMTIQYGDRSFSLQPGTHVMDDLVLGPGDHTFIVTAGSGSFFISWQEGAI